MIGNPGLLQKLPDIAALLPEGGGDGEQAAAADGAAGRLDAMADLALNHRLAQGGGRSAALLVGSIPSISRKVQRPSATGSN